MRQGPPADIRDAVAEAIGRTVLSVRGLSGGCVGDVFKLTLDDGTAIVAKTGDAGSGLDREGYMLTYLKEHSALPVPDVLHAADSLLLMSWVEGGGALGPEAQTHAADLVAALHGVTSDRFGFARDTTIGGLHQPNPGSPTWIDFFAEQRLMYMGRAALDAGLLPGRAMNRIERLAARLDRWLEEPARPSLIHGDMWGGNVLAAAGRIRGFIDPAVYYADPEIELAFTTLFGTFTDAFFRRYAENRPIRPGFFEERRDLYNLYPLLVHVRLFGGPYVASVEATLARFGV